MQSDVRSAAGLGPWEVISAGPTNGAATGTANVATLADMQGQGAAGSNGTSANGSAQVVFSAELGGLEDVPPGVVAVLTTSPVDLLSHIAIRARNLGVLLATCTDGTVWDAAIRDHKGRVVEVTAGPGAGDLTLLAASGGASAGTTGGGSKGAVTLQAPARSREWALPQDAFSPGAVGGKSLGVQQLAKIALKSGFQVPPAFTLPFGTFERTLEAAPRDACERVHDALDALASTDQGGSALDMPRVRDVLRQVHDAVLALPLPRELQGAVADVARQQGGEVAEWSAIADNAGAAEEVRRSGLFVLSSVAGSVLHVVALEGAIACQFSVGSIEHLCGASRAPLLARSVALL